MPVTGEFTPRACYNLCRWHISLFAYLGELELNCLQTSETSFMFVFKNFSSPGRILNLFSQM